MGPTLGMNVKLAHKHKVDTSYKGALFRANLDSCELYYILVLSSCHACTVPSGALKATITPRLLPGPLDRLSHSGTEPFWHATYIRPILLCPRTAYRVVPRYAQTWAAGSGIESVQLSQHFQLAADRDRVVYLGVAS